VAGGIYKSLPAKKGRKVKKKIQFKVGCLMHYKGKPSAFYIDRILMRSWHHQFPCSVKDEIRVCIVWELEDSVFNILNYSACQYAKTGNICFTVVNYFDVNITDFSDLCHNNAL
jgi:hypothetical protein